MDTGSPHETRHTLEADAHALLDGLGSHPGHSVGLLGLSVNLADALSHHRVGDAALGRGSLSPGKETAGRVTEDAAHGGAHRKVGLASPSRVRKLRGCRIAATGKPGRSRC